MTKPPHPCAVIADGLETLAAVWHSELPVELRVQQDQTIDQAHAAGWWDGQKSSVTHLTFWVEHLRYVVENDFPWCDTCKLPAAWNNSAGWMHSTPGHPYGVYPNYQDDTKGEPRDASGHEVTAIAWQNR